MEKIKKILAPTDLSELSEVGVRYALDLAKAVGAEVTLYHVVTYEELVKYGEVMTEKLAIGSTFQTSGSVLEKYERALARLIKERFSDLIPPVKVNQKVELGAPDVNIVEQAKKEGADLIVISTHGRSGLSHIFIGSVTEKVVRHAHCPVLSIRPAKEEKAARKVAVFHSIGSRSYCRLIFPALRICGVKGKTIRPCSISIIRSACRLMCGSWVTKRRV